MWTGTTETTTTTPRIKGPGKGKDKKDKKINITALFLLGNIPYSWSWVGTQFPPALCKALSEPGWCQKRMEMESWLFIPTRQHEHLIPVAVEKTWGDWNSILTYNYETFLSLSDSGCMNQWLARVFISVHRIKPHDVTRLRPQSIQ